MTVQPLSLSTDQVAAFVEVARLGSLRAAAEVLFLSEQGLRSRLLALEGQLGVELYRKQRGLRSRTPLTPEGQRLLPHALELLDKAAELRDAFREDSGPHEAHVVASQYLIAYVLIPVVRRFHARFPQIRVRLSARTERDIEQALLQSQDYSFGMAAPYESAPELEYRHLFSMHWSLITPREHPLAARARPKLAEVVKYPLILYERGSTGRQHVIEAFQQHALTPHVEMEATNTDLVVRMVEAGLGIGVVPLHPSGAVTRGRRVVIRPLGQQVRPIQSGVLLAKGTRLSPPATQLLGYLVARSAS